MKSLRALVPLVFVALSLVTPVAANAATANFFGPILSEECRCEESAPDWGCVLQTIQNVINLGVSLAVIYFVLVASYAGVLFMTSATNAGNKSKAKGMLGATVVGLLIALSAWLLVDFVMKALYRDPGGWGPWNSILAENSGQHCLESQQSPAGPTDGPDGQESGSATSTPQQSGTVTGGSCPGTGCVNLGPEVSCSAQGCQVSSSLKNALDSINDVGTGWTVTEGYPPSRTHRAACHNNGTCVDVAFRPATYEADTVVAFMGAARTAGLRAVFETTDCNLRTTIRQRGFQAYCRSDGGGYENITGTHFSVYSR